MERDLRYYAKVHSYETFGTVDGPGIRFIIFLQGCHLKCKYCHNRDTWDINGGSYKTIDEIFDKIMKYKSYIKASNGGITVTGGEPLLQVKFVKELFTRLKKEGFHTCIDTSGIIAITDDVKETLKYTDLVLLDIKHIDDEKCKELTGCSNKRELEFARYLSDNGIKMWIRQVILPGITDNDDETYINAQIFPNMEAITEQLKGSVPTKEEIKKIVSDIVQTVNSKLPNYKHIKSFIVREEEFEKTTTKKIKRFGKNMDVK